MCSFVNSVSEVFSDAQTSEVSKTSEV